MNTNQDGKYIDELIATANVIEATRSTVLKVGLEYFPPVEPARLDEIISKVVTGAARGQK